MPGWNLGTRCFQTWRLIIREGKARARALRERWRVGSLLSLLRKLSSKFAFIAFAQYGACWMNADWSLTTGPLDCARTYKDEWNLGTRWLTTWRLSKARARALQERWRVGSLFFFRLAIIIYLQPWKKGRKLTVLKTRPFEIVFYLFPCCADIDRDQQPTERAVCCEPPGCCRK